ncbi:indolepyruvate oxidoreductase subunit beta [Microaceticoccus formicicus]|uniref:indolepyruvate oxidoreductase subunit beta n=1 Tax=Microaceticoccus formicicus TaxID=3118105 RepID=UPI003CD02F08|nr:indolepyruvate oxidoreductase subunit beta [Peptoniphilaceae bacterium AMB_02]
METKNIMIVGVGGQGTLLTSRILGGIILESGYDVKLSEVHGMAQRGGSVTTFVRYGDKVFEPIVEEGCADILIAFEKLEALRYAHFLKKEGILIVNDQRIDPMPVVIGKEEYPKDIFERLEDKYDLVVVDALNEARKLGNVRVFNVIVLGIVSRYLGIEKEVWEKVIRNTVPVKTVELNLAAFEIGRNISKEKNYD